MTGPVCNLQKPTSMPANSAASKTRTDRFNVALQSEDAALKCAAGTTRHCSLGNHGNPLLLFRYSELANKTRRPPLGIKRRT